MTGAAEPPALGRLELLVEPFVENDPGPHVLAAWSVLEQAGLDLNVGAFSTTVDGDLDQLVALVDDVAAAGFGAGAQTISVRIERR